MAEAEEVPSEPEPRAETASRTTPIRVKVETPTPICAGGLQSDPVLQKRPDLTYYRQIPEAVQLPRDVFLDLHLKASLLEQLRPSAFSAAGTGAGSVFAGGDGGGGGAAAATTVSGGDGGATTSASDSAATITASGAAATTTATGAAATTFGESPGNSPMATPSNKHSYPPRPRPLSRFQ